MKTLTVLLGLLRALWIWWVRRHTDWLLPRPGPFSLTTRKDLTMKTFPTTAHLPTLPTPNDIARQELIVTVNGKAGDPQDVPLGTTETLVGKFAEGDEVSVSLTYVDDANPANRSESRTETLTIHDTVAPPQPGEFGLSTTEEIA